MDIALKVDAEVLKEKSLEVESEIKTLESHIDEIRNIVQRTNGYWIGVSGDKARKEFNNQQENTDLVLRRFREHPQELRQMAGIYIEGENRILAQNQQLPTDGII